MDQQTSNPPATNPLSTEPSLRQRLASHYDFVRSWSELLCEPLHPEDCVIQTMPDVSPTRWHLAHTTWFFETFILAAASENYQPFHPQYGYLFNSYYNTVGEQFPRPQRGFLSRPTLDEVWAYRWAIDDRLLEFIQTCSEASLLQYVPVIEIGLHHEQQHQELILTDIKHVFSCNPLYPVYRSSDDEKDSSLSAEQNPIDLQWKSFEGGVVEIGHQGEAFAYDNEGPRHRVHLESFELADRLVTNGEWLAFLEDGGYQRPELWLSAGWATVQESAWKAPRYWFKQGQDWHHFTLSGLKPLALDEPVCHVSFYEADAFARWLDARLPTEAEWEVACGDRPLQGHFVEEENFAPLPAPTAPDTSLQQMYGDVWEWTASPYLGYPGYKANPGALGEYNGKFMCNQFVLRGGSCATSKTHIRPTYRNFFDPAARWQFSGLRLAR
ncbi:Formylglycine-generating sulfatase enzyme [Planctomycetales bacterium 10988]|nr:Formylglycine-generating sulfatase enzyme [Planctomycetales bacterium 10988]